MLKGFNMTIHKHKHKPTVPIQRPCNNKNNIHYFKVDKKLTQMSLENGYWACCKRCDYKYFFVIQDKSAWLKEKK